MDYQKGMQRMYNLGKMLRERYKDFLKNSNFDNFYSRSTNLDRTKMSLQLLLAGLNPPSDDNRWSDELNWIPMPFHCKEISSCQFIIFKTPK